MIFAVPSPSYDLPRHFRGEKEPLFSARHDSQFHHPFALQQFLPRSVCQYFDSIPAGQRGSRHYKQ